MKRVLFFSHYPTRFGIDGANNMLVQTAAGMPSDKYEKLVLLPSKGAASDYLDSHGVEYKILPYNCGAFNQYVYGTVDKDFDSICETMEDALENSRIYQFVKSWNPDIVYANTSMAIMGAVMGKMAGARVIWHIHDIAEGILSETDHDNLNRIIARYADKIVMVSKAIRGDLRETGLLPNAELVYIGVKDPGFTEAQIDSMNLSIREKLGIGISEPVIAYLGQIVPLKGIDRFVKAANLILKRVPQAKFLIIGNYDRDKSYTAYLKKLIALCGIKTSMFFTGYCSSLPDLIPAIDCLVVPSAYEEPFGAISVEANLYYKPVVAFDRGGIGEGVVHGKNGFLVGKDNIKHMASAIYTIIRSSKLKKIMGRYGYSRAVNKFGFDRYMENMAEILEEVSEGRYEGKPVRNGNLAKGESLGLHYIFRGFRYSINEQNMLDPMGLDGSDIVAVDDSVLKSIPELSVRNRTGGA